MTNNRPFSNLFAGLFKNNGVKMILFYDYLSRPMKPCFILMEVNLGKVSSDIIYFHIIG